MFLRLIILHLRIHSSFGLVVDPLSDEEFVLVVVVVAALAFPHVVHPLPLKVVSIPLGKHPVPVPPPLVPLPLEYVLVLVDHPPLPLRHPTNPKPIVPIAVLVEKGASAVLLVFVPVTRVLSTQLAAPVLLLHPPVRTLTVPLVLLPHSLVLVPILVELNSESFFSIVVPVSHIPACHLPLLSSDGSIFLSLLLSDPVHRPVRPILLRLLVMLLPLMLEL
mmetsp:Transcript_17908/g.12871  ORF Transcript_17908/g.12871 Transcript_17908/m.12871 type:complete len:220 (-) Transcript_17908:75-734(-)